MDCRLCVFARKSRLLSAPEQRFGPLNPSYGANVVPGEYENTKEEESS